MTNCVEISVDVHQTEDWNDQDGRRVFDAVASFKREHAGERRYVTQMFYMKPEYGPRVFVIRLLRDTRNG